MTEHTWEDHKLNWIKLAGKPDCFVRTKPLAQGYLWQHGKQYGHEETLKDAINWAEAAREFYPRHV